jgi:hypothetical protein
MLVQLHLQHWHAHPAENAQWYDLSTKLVKLLHSVQKHITWCIQYSLSYQNVIKQEIWHERNNVRLLKNENEI